MLFNEIDAIRLVDEIAHGFDTVRHAARWRVSKPGGEAAIHAAVRRVKASDAVCHNLLLRKTVPAHTVFVNNLVVLFECILLFALLIGSSW
jgi:hypothetical protein